MAIVRRLFLLSLFLALPAMGQVFNCAGSIWSTSTGSCKIGILGPSGPFEVVGSNNSSTPTVTGGNLVFPTGSNHIALSLMYQTAVNVQAFTTTFTFVPDGQNLSFVINNCPAGNPGCGGGTSGYSYFGLNSFSAGASCEGGFYQGFTGNPIPINVFALMFDSYAYLQSTDSGFTYSSAQIYQQNQSPCNPTSGGQLPYWSTTKISTAPVPLNSPSNSQNTTTGDTYSATITYDGSTVTLNLFDVTASGSCPGASCFTKTWSNVSIPSQVDGTTGYIGLVLSSGLSTSFPLDIKGWTYTVNSPTASPGSTATSAGSTTAANPTFSPSPGTYSSTQNVTVTCSTANSNAVYSLGAPGLTLTPLANNLGGVGVGTAYSGPVAISSTNTLYANCGVNNNSNAGYLPSGVVQGAYTITAGGAASTPTFSPVAGSYTGTQSVTASTSSSGCGPYIYFDTNPTPTTNQTTLSVASSETVYAYVHGCPGFTDSTVASAAFTIKAATPTFSPAAGTYVGTQSVTVSATSGSVKCYNFTGAPTTNGTTGCGGGSTLYSGPVSVSSTETLYAVSGGTGVNDSLVGSAAYTINTTATPVITLASGAYSFPTTTTITDATGGSVIHYCTTTYLGSCSPSTTYTTTLTISSSETVCASAVFNSSTSATQCNNYGPIVPASILGGRFNQGGNGVLQ